MNEQEYNKLYLGEPGASILMELRGIAREANEGYSEGVVKAALLVAKTEREGAIEVFKALIHHIKVLDDMLLHRETMRVVPQSVIMKNSNTP